MHAIPYAGITQVRFKGYFLSLNRHPLLLQAFLPQTPAEIKGNLSKACVVSIFLVSTIDNRRHLERIKNTGTIKNLQRASFGEFTRRFKNHQAVIVVIG